MDLTEPFQTVYPYTQASPARQENLLRLSAIIEEEMIPGAIVECGVLDGGMSALMAYGTAKSGREVHMFDSWEGLPEITTEDGIEGDRWVGECVGSPRSVASVMCKLGIAPSRLRFHRGWFHDTFPLAVNEIDSVALLHVDCDFYTPVKLTMETWFSKMAPGGFVQIDDYDSFSGCQMAIDEFLKSYLDIKLETFGRSGIAYFFRNPRTTALRSSAEEPRR